MLAKRIADNYGARIQEQIVVAEMCPARASSVEMDVINAIAKVRFSSARAQRVQLHKCPQFTCELVCLEPQQEMSAVGRCAYYVVAGNGNLKAGKHAGALKMGNLAALDDDESHTLVNSSEQRLILLAISKHA